MPYIPHTESEVSQMLEAIGEKQIEALFDEIPSVLRCSDLPSIPEGINELELNRVVSQKTSDVKLNKNFIGAGAYEHHIPACVWDITSRGEFLTAYTPYQAEASQGTLQLLYEYQTMMAKLTGMDASNASLYDGASALAEAILMAVRCNKKSKSKRILFHGYIHPRYLDTVNTIVKSQEVELVNATGELSKFDQEDVAALVVQYPNFLGGLDDVDSLTRWAHQHNALMIACVNPTALALLKPPGEWGDEGADIVCGEGQPLGVPLASGGPYFGFMTTKLKYVRQLPGRLIGRTVDAEGKEGFALTLQAREQHIRRSKATSNICTNQGLLVTAATIYLSVLGEHGLRATAEACYVNTKLLLDKLLQIDGVEKILNQPHFHEVAIRLPCDVDKVLLQMSQHEIDAGLSLKSDHPELGEALLFCVTETKTAEEIEQYADKFAAAVKEVMSCS